MDKLKRYSLIASGTTSIAIIASHLLGAKDIDLFSLHIQLVLSFAIVITLLIHIFGDRLDPISGFKVIFFAVVVTTMSLAISVLGSVISELGFFALAQPPEISIPIAITLSLFTAGFSWLLTKFLGTEWVELQTARTKCSPTPKLCQQCQNCAHSPHLLCATNPDGPGLDGCRYFLSKSIE